MHTPCLFAIGIEQLWIPFKPVALRPVFRKVVFESAIQRFCSICFKLLVGCVVAVRKALRPVRLTGRALLAVFICELKRGAAIFPVKVFGRCIGIQKREILNALDVQMGIIIALGAFRNACNLRQRLAANRLPIASGMEGGIKCGTNVTDGAS